MNIETYLPILYSWMAVGTNFIQETAYFLTRPVILLFVVCILVYVVGDIVRKLVS